jgi:hypothetical protein
MNFHVLWVCHAPSRIVTPKRTITPLHGPSAPKRSHPPINHRISWTRAPHPWVFPFPCALPCVDHCDSPWVCRWGRPTSPVHPCCQGKMVPLLGNAPKLSHPCPNKTQVPLIHHKGRRVCAPLAHTSPSCPKVLLPMPIRQVLAQPITSSLCSSSILSSNLPKEHTRSVGVTEGLTLMMIINIDLF